MNVIRISSNGAQEVLNMTKKDILSQYGVHHRDLRIIYTRKEMSVIRPARNSIIFSVRSIKILLLKGEMIIFHGEAPKIQKYFLPFLIERIQNTAKEDYEAFEHLALEFSLTYVIDKFQRRFEDLERTSTQMLEKLNEKKLNDKTFEQLLHLKKRLSTLGTHLAEIEEELTELVDDEDDLQEFYLDRQEDEEVEIENIESILENALEPIENLTHKTQELEDNIDDAQEILTLKMNNIRNMVIKFDLLLTTIACFFALLAVVTGLYGMNIQNHLETNPIAFRWILIGMGSFFLFGFGVLAIWMKRKRII